MSRLTLAVLAAALVVGASGARASSWVSEVSIGPVISESFDNQDISPISVALQGRWLGASTDELSFSTIVRYRNEPYGSLLKPFSPAHVTPSDRGRGEGHDIERTHFFEFGFGLSAFRPGAGIEPFADLELGGAWLSNSDGTASPFLAGRFGVARKLGDPVHAYLSVGMRAYPIDEHTAAEVSLGLMLGHPATGRNRSGG